MNFSDIVLGNFTPEQRVVNTVLPAVIGASYFAVGYFAYLIRCAIWGQPIDREIASRGQSVLIGLHLRHFAIWVTRPLWFLIMASGVRATTITMLAVFLGVAAGGAVAMGRFAVGGWLFLFSGILDLMDGRVARARNQVSRAGAAIDSVLDRYVDSAMLMGLAWYYRESWALIPVLMALLGTSLVPYVRAKAEAMGVDVKGGVMQRAERILYLGGAVTLSPILEAVLFPYDRHPVHYLAVVGITFLAISSNVTAVARFRTLVATLTTESRKRPDVPANANSNGAVAPLRLAPTAATAVAVRERADTRGRLDVVQRGRSSTV